jgi:hypothetical protein
MIINEIQALFPNRQVKVMVSLKVATYQQIKATPEQLGPTIGQTAIIELETEQDAEFAFLNIRKSLSF